MAASLSLGPQELAQRGCCVAASEDSEREIVPFNSTYTLQHV